MIPVDQRAWHICFSTPTAACHLANWSNWNCCVNFPWFWEEAVWSMIRPPYMVHVKALLCGQKNVSFIYGAKFYEDDVQSHADTHQCLLCGGLVALITTTSRIRWIQNGNVIGNHACFAMHKEDQRGSSDQFSQEPLREWSLTHLLALWHAPMTVLQQMVSADTWSIAQPLPPAAAAPDFLWGDWHVDPQKKSGPLQRHLPVHLQFNSNHCTSRTSNLYWICWIDYSSISNPWGILAPISQSFASRAASSTVIELSRARASCHSRALQALITALWCWTFGHGGKSCLPVFPMKHLKW